MVPVEKSGSLSGTVVGCDFLFCQVTPNIGWQGRGEVGGIRLMEEVDKLS